ncbi:MAG: hypothetical protein A1D16_01075 [Flavihumibacter sp. CACIAM 22H1]|nr:MAG: hypothetical protein A1D16_01075 [Flavihumibacter sp. CACIAM 22H1]
MAAMNVYFIPGLGADKRVFRHIQLPDGYKVQYINWLSPEPAETLTHYAQRLAAQIPEDAPWCLVGLSFGGMLATEISKFRHPEKTILIASIQSAHELPFYFRWAAPLRLHKIIPIGLFKQASLAKRLFTTETKEDKELLRKIIQESDPAFLRWAMGAILNWKPAPPAGKLYHIHGTGDRLLPIRFTNPTHFIKGAGHLMVMNRAAEINQALAAILVDKK